MAFWNYYQDTRYCPRCQEYVRFLKSPQDSYCVECGTKVSLFSSEDRRRFQRSLRTGKSRPSVGRAKRVS